MMAMSTALITFMLEAPPNAFSVELLGSWDNFYRPYELSRDKRAGKTQWRGCHRFENITCDGDLSDSSLKRDGALKMGGTYWYYYRVNGDWEYHDPDQPSTTMCPSLPGQMLNVLDVPVQANPAGTSHPNESLEDLVFTLNPKDKYAPLGVRRSATTSAVRRQRHLENQTRNEVEPPVIPDFSYDHHESETPVSQHEPNRSPQHGLYAAIQRLRRTKSSGPSSQRGSSRLGSAWSRKLLSRAKSSRKVEASDEIPEVPQITPDLLQHMQDLTLATGRTGALRKADTCSLHATGSQEEPQPDFKEQVAPGHGPATSSPPPDAPSPLSSIACDRETSQTPVSSLVASPQIVSSITSDPSACIETNMATTSNQDGDGLQAFTAPLTDTVHQQHLGHECYKIGLTEAIKDHAFEEQSHFQEPCFSEPSSLSYTSSEHYSPGLMSNGTSSRRVSSIHLSQPETPVTTTFDDSAVAWQRTSDPSLETLGATGMYSDFDFSLPAPRDVQQPEISCHLNGFQGYSLPNHEQASSVTLKKPPTRDRLPPFVTPASSQHVKSWNESAPQRGSGAAGMMDELGYLGTLIN